MADGGNRHVFGLGLVLAIRQEGLLLHRKMSLRVDNRKVVAEKQPASAPKPFKWEYAEQRAEIETS